MGKGRCAKMWRDAMSQKILLVDDDANIRMMLGDFLMASGYEVTCVESGDRALQVMAKALPDLIILDMGMPGMSGTVFLERITDAFGRTQVPVLVLTARGDMAEFFADKRIGGFLTKPADPDELLAEVQRVLFVESDLPKDDTRMVGSDVRRLVVLAEKNPIFASAFCEALAEVGFSVEVVHTGAEAVESVIARRPAGLVLPLDAAEIPADGVLEILRKLPSSKTLPVVVYAAEVKPYVWSFIDPRNVAKVEGRKGAAIAQAALEVIK
jgi:DNA-binding response OmpR family regulator